MYDLKSRKDFNQYYIDSIEKDEFISSQYTMDEWTKIADKFFELNKDFAKVLLDGVDLNSTVSIETTFDDFIMELMDRNAKININGDPMFNEDFFSRYLVIKKNNSFKRPLERLKPDSNSIKSTLSSNTLDEIQDEFDDYGDIDFEDEFDNLNTDNLPEPEPIESEQYDLPDLIEDDLLDTPVYSKEELDKAITELFVYYIKKFETMIGTKEHVEKTEVYYNSHHLSELPLWELNQELRSDLVDSFVERHSDEFDNGDFDPLKYVVWDELQQAYIENGVELTKLINSDLQELLRTTINL